MERRTLLLVLTALLAGCPTGLPPLDDAPRPDSVTPDVATTDDGPLADLALPDALPDAPVPDLPSCATGTKQTQTFNLAFPGSTPPCPWGTGDNGAAQAGQFTARVEHVKPLGLPTGAVLCDMTFNVPETGLSYNDSMLLTFDEAVLLAGMVDVPTLFPATNGLNIYDWKLMLNKSGSLPTFCIGNSTCSAPDTRSQGTLSLILDAASVQALSSRALALGRFDFMVVAAGDNDTAADCSYSPFTLEVTATYVQ